MRYAVLLGLLLVMPPAWADRVCLERGTGRLLEYQQRASAGTLLENARRAGYQDAQIEEREITPAEWAALREAQIDAPARQRRKARETERKDKAESLRQKLGLSPSEFEDLREALRE